MSILKGNFNKPTDTLVKFMNQVTNSSDGAKENELNLPNCKYKDTDYFKNLTKEGLIFFSYERLLTY